MGALRTLNSSFDPMIVAALLAQKAVTRELGSGQLPEPIASLIDAEFATARERWLDEPCAPQPETLAAANALFRRWLSQADS